MAQLIMQSTPVLTLVSLITTSYTVYACLESSPDSSIVHKLFIQLNTHRYKVFATRIKNQGGGGKNTPEENLQYLMSLKSDFDEISKVSSQMNLAYKPAKIFELLCWMTS